MMILMMKMMTMGGYAPPLHIRSLETEAQGASAYLTNQSENIMFEEPRCLADTEYLHLLGCELRDIHITIS
jgi:hypothetical protein